jgi:hypothetical protein
MATQHERYLQGYNVPHSASSKDRRFGKNPQGVSIFGDTRSSKPTSTIRKKFSFFNPLKDWRDSAIHESVQLAQPLTKQNIQMHNEAVEHINKMNAAKLATMSSKDVANLAQAMAKNRASAKHKGGKKKSRKSMKSRKTRRNCK